MKRFALLLFTVITFSVLLATSGCEKLETYIVTFNANGGVGTMQAQRYTESVEYALSRNAFSYVGHTFAGWNTSQDGSGTSYRDGQVITVTADMTLYAQWTSNGTNPTPSTSGTINGHEYIDLGLSSGLLWAYYAWGETTAKTRYDWSNYKWCNGSDSTLTKYCHVSSFGYNGFTDELTTLEASDDAAVVNWGGGWRMPTEDELYELMYECTKNIVTQNGVIGYLFTGPNGNTIFLPLAGIGHQSGFSYAGSEGYYWSSTLNTDYPESENRPDFARVLRFTSDNYYLSITGRLYGRSVRPVYEPTQK